MSESSTQYHNPPGFATRILGFLLKDPIHETPLGDFEEFYNWIAEEKGVFSASIWYWTQVLNLLRKKMSYSIQRSIEMLKSYFKTAFRNMLSHKIFSLINIFGLSLGISVCLLIFSYVRFEFSFDRFHENSDNIYRVLREVTRPDRPVRIVSGTSCPMRDLFIETYPEIQYVSRIVDETSTIIMNDNFFDHTIHYVDPEFLKLFSYNILNGDRNEPLKDLNSVVITQSMAAKFFDNEDPIGKEIIFDLNDEKIVSHVTAVIEDPPLNSSIRFEFLIPFMKLKETWGEDWFETYGANSPETYLMLVDNTDRAIFEEKMGIAADIITKEIYTRDDTKLKLYLQPLKDIYLESDISQNVAKTTNPVYSYILSLLCALLLLIACVNYILLSVGRSAGRAREIGVRKVLGAFKKQLVKQYLGEAMFVSMLALIFGFMLASLMLPTFNELSGRDISLNIEPLYIMFGILIMLTVGIIAGSYPALLLSSFKPVSVLKSSLKIGVNNVFGKGLIILQFSITIFLLSTAFIMRDQLDFMLNKDLGYDSSHIAMVDLQVEGDGAEEFFGLLKNELSGNKDIVKISAQSGTFGRQWTRIGFRDPQGKLYDFAINTVDYDYLKTMDIKLIQGRDFSREFGTDKENSIIVNQAFVDYFGFENPLEAKLPAEKYQDRNIIGVVENFNFLSLHSEVKPLAMVLDEDVLVFGDLWGWGSFPVTYSYAVLKIRADNLLDTFGQIESKWGEIAPDKPFEISFLDDDLQAQYKLELRWRKIINITTILAFIVGCLGMLGLASITVERRLREVGIRKVLGASAIKITGLLTADLIKLVLISNIAAWPIGIYVANNWLGNFAYRTDINLTAFVLSALITALIAVLTISFHSIRAAFSNPVNSLKCE